MTASQKLFTSKNPHLIQQSISSMLSKNTTEEEVEKIHSYMNDYDDFMMDSRQTSPSTTERSRKGKARDQEQDENFQFDIPEKRPTQKRKPNLSPPTPRVPAISPKVEPSLVYIDNWSQDSVDLESTHNNKLPPLKEEEPLEQEENRPVKEQDEIPPVSLQQKPRQALKMVPTNIKNLVSKVQAESKHQHAEGTTCNACEKVIQKNLI